MKVHPNVGLGLLSVNQMEDIHLATLEVLSRVGVEVYDNETLSLLANAGAEVEGSRVRIPPHMVRDALASAPQSVPIASRQAERVMWLEKGRVYFGTGSDTPYTIDLDQGQRRPSVRADIARASRLADALPHVDFVMSMGIPSDVPQDRCDVYEFYEMVVNTVKPIVFTAIDERGVADIIEMASAVVGGERELARNPFIILYTEPSSPLQHSFPALRKLRLCARKRVPVIYAPAVMRGATGPVTLAGGLVVANAEILSGLVIHQLEARGAPFVYGGGVPPMDMRTSVCSYGSPERDLSCQCLVALGKYYGLPTFTTAGCSDAQVFDQQAGLEAGFNLLMAGLGGGNLIHDLGYIGIGLTASLEMLVLCNEGASMVKRILAGVQVNEETLALEVIERVGPGGNFLAEKHTLAHFRQHLAYSELLNRDHYEGWLAAGRTTFGERATRKVREILSTHEVPALPEAVRRRLLDICARPRG